MDLVTDVLEVSGVSSTVGARIEAGTGWSLALDDYPGAALHAVTGGSAWLSLPGRDPIELVTGDIALIPTVVPHRLSDAPGPTATPCTQLPASGVIQVGEPPVRTRIVTVHYDCDHEARTQILGTLPDFLHMTAGSGTPGLDDTVRMIGRELTHPQFATTALLNSLVDVMLIQLLRAWIPTRPPELRGTWLGAFEDPIVHQALEHLHADPARPWTTAALADAIAVSRATLSRRFPAAMGQSPGAYLTQWRMDLAANRLRKTHDSIETIAAAVGYGSAPAFVRAFARSRGKSPARYRLTRG
ncbi:AraC family transcriptional regulator [Winogradskya humida]|uniref:AraC family transcriptional regulator n=1 Tax=Winogradskya humida TaxID=113566 RepID=A0ABQ3ZNU9_9ACTN|nr:cupin domain-containing protein [Actinoplanes humidus]GIE20231.1 AraC family transcriptional regulator [Actinoplanes humidus]